MAVSSSSIVRELGARGVVLSERIVHYVVAGATREQIAECMRVAGPQMGGQRFAARTAWQVRWSLAKRSAGTLGTPLVDVAVVMNLPRWIPVKAAPSLHESWSAFLEGLVAHEAGHRDIAIDAGLRVLEALRAHVDSRDASDETVRARIETILDRASDAELRYDVETRHGEIDPRVCGLPWERAR